MGMRELLCGVVVTRILITGHTGFIGHNLVRYLSDRDGSAEIIGFSRSHGLDVLNYEQVLKETRGVDIVFHLAAYAKPAESEDRRIL